MADKLPTTPGMELSASPALAAPLIEGVFPLLCTPYAEDGSLDCAALAREARFVAGCGADGVIWPCAKDALDYLAPVEIRRGLEVVAAALDGAGVRFVPCCPGRDTADMLSRVADAESVVAAHPGLPSALLVRLADDVADDTACGRQYEALAAATRLPVIVQTYNGKSPMPSPSLLLSLARRHPATFGWFKVEGTGPEIPSLKRALVASRPVVKTVFTGWGGRDWLYDHRCIGTRGVISQRPMYADLMVRIWHALWNGDPSADDFFAKFMHLRNLEEALPAPEMRGWNLYVLQRRGIFANTLSRTHLRADGGWDVAGVEISDSDRAEIDVRLKFALSP